MADLNLIIGFVFIIVGFILLFWAFKSNKNKSEKLKLKTIKKSFKKHKL